MLWTGSFAIIRCDYTGSARAVCLRGFRPKVSPIHPSSGSGTIAVREIPFFHSFSVIGGDPGARDRDRLSGEAHGGTVELWPPENLAVLHSCDILKG